MTVYIDSAKSRLGHMIVCYTAADTLEELHAMADRLGVQRRFQDKPGAPHYDISKMNRERSIRHGATEVQSRELLTREYRSLAYRGWR